MYHLLTDFANLLFYKQITNNNNDNNDNRNNKNKTKNDNNQNINNIPRFYPCRCSCVMFVIIGDGNLFSINGFIKMAA